MLGKIVVIPIFKGKGNVQECENYKGINFMSHTMKIWENNWFKDQRWNICFKKSVRFYARQIDNGADILCKMSDGKV